MKKIRAALAIAGVLAGVGLTAAPAQAAATTASDATICYGKMFGGAFFCGGAYGNGEDYILDNGNVQDFVVGTDHAVWTYWTGPDSQGWISLGGYVTSKVTASPAAGTGGYCTISVTGTDGHQWHRSGAHAVWSAWSED